MPLSRYSAPVKRSRILEPVEGRKTSLRSQAKIGRRTFIEDHRLLIKLFFQPPSD